MRTERYDLYNMRLFMHFSQRTNNKKQFGSPFPASIEEFRSAKIMKNNRLFNDYISCRGNAVLKWNV